MKRGRLMAMGAYESRIRAWARERNKKDLLNASIEEVEEFMRSAGHIGKFYEAFPIYDPACEFEVVTNPDRANVLEYCAQINKLSEGYDRAEGYLGESFCVDQLNMRKNRQGTKDIDGDILGRSAQVKFKWINAGNLGTRYVSIKPESEFDLLIVTCAQYGDSEVSLFGIWEKADVLSVVGARNRVYLRKLRTQPQSKILRLLPKINPKLISEFA